MALGNAAQERMAASGDGVDLDIRDGRCYPTDTVPLQFQTARSIAGDIDLHRLLAFHSVIPDSAKNVPNTTGCYTPGSEA